MHDMCKYHDSSKLRGFKSFVLKALSDMKQSRETMKYSFSKNTKWTNISPSS